MESGDVLASCTSLYSIGRARKKLLLSCSNPRPDSCLGKISRRACAFLDESLAWVLTEVALPRMHNICVQQPASQAILRRSARSIPMFRADAPPIRLKNRRTFALFTREEVGPTEGKRRGMSRSPPLISSLWTENLARRSVHVLFR
jgi:hypothetical protein